MPVSIDGPTDLYRYFDAEGQLLYVGISFSAIARASQHRKEKGWWTEFTNMTVERFDTRSQAEAAEIEAIKSESPVHNVIHNRSVVRPSTAAPWVCGSCESHFGRKKGDGYIQVHWNVMWQSVCASCDQLGDNSRYWIDGTRISNLAEVERWTHHLLGKRWLVPGEWSDCIWRSCTITGAHESARSIIDKRSPMTKAEREWESMQSVRADGTIKLYGLEDLEEAAAFVDARAHEIRTGSASNLHKLNYVRHSCGTYTKLHHTSDSRRCGHFYCYGCREHFRTWTSNPRWPKDVPVWPDKTSDSWGSDDRDALWAEHIASTPKYEWSPA